MEQLKPYNIYSYRELCNSIGEEPVKGGNKRVAQEKCGNLRQPSTRKPSNSKVSFFN